MASDGGVQAKLEAAKKTLGSAEKFEKSAGGPMPSTPKPSYTQARAARKPETNVGQELKDKQANVEQYAQQYGNK